MINDSNYNDDDGKKHQICQKLWRFVTIAVILDKGTQATKENQQHEMKR